MEIINKKLKIIKNFRLTEKYFKLILDCSDLTRHARPGQFLHIKVDDGFDPLLRRPLSIHRVMGSKIEIVYEIVGRGTKILSEKSSGDTIDILGPLGRGFDISEKRKAKSEKLVLIAGGIGVAPLVFLAQKLKQPPLVLIGAKTKNEVLCEKEFKNLGCDLKIATDNGSLGLKGNAIDLLNKYLLNPYNLIPTAIYACGPDSMLKPLQRIVAEKNILTQVSLDEAMGCGIGACLACAINTKNGQKRVCHDGPVFDIKELIFD